MLEKNYGKSIGDNKKENIFFPYRVKLNTNKSIGIGDYIVFGKFYPRKKTSIIVITDSCIDLKVDINRTLLNMYRLKEA